MSNWIFVMTGKLEDFKKRIESKKWPIFRLTHHRKAIKKGDKILFYLGGKPNKKILGSAVLSSRIKTESDEFSIGLDDVEIWKKSVMMKQVLEEIDFIKNKKNWGIYFQGGITALTEKNFKKIINFKNILEIEKQND